jgi:hypothetical protein
LKSILRLLSFLGCLVLLLTAATAHAQQRPLVTEDPETIGSGLVLIEGGVDYQHDLFYPVSGLTGNLWKVGTLGVSFGVSSIAEIQIDGGIINRLAVTDQQRAPLSDELTFTGENTKDFEDIVIGTKIRIVEEDTGRPAFGLRFATRLPNASTESGIGLDTTDFFASALIGKTVQSIRIVGNAGIAVLTDPTRGYRQNDVITYGASLARAVQQGVEIVGEINGRVQMRDHDTPPGTESRAMLRGGARFTRGTVRVDGALLVGLTDYDPSFGFTAGLTWVFRGFTIP